MDVKLTINQPYLSIVTFPTASLPPFTLITGLNGSGKTHLLKAIETGHVRAAGVDHNKAEIRYFDWNNLIPGNEGVFQSSQLDQERQKLIQQLENTFTQQQHQITITANHCGLPNELLSRPREVARLTLDELTNILGDAAKAKNAHKAIQEAVEIASQNMRAKLKKGHISEQQIDLLVQATGRPLFAAYDRETFVEQTPAAWGRMNLFQRSFGRLFVAYRDLLVRNDLRTLAKERGDVRVRPLSKEEFEQKYNIPPWDFLNTTLADAGLDFEINQPNRYELGSYQPKLRKRSSGAEINFEDLSSGEKILMSFANCLYYVRDKRQISVFPKLLLLDEVDAPLHPSMSRNLTQAITETLVRQFNISVIATTHSPSTVAIAREEAIHVMKANVPGVHKTSKGEALSLLTTGVPTLSINFSGRRQVFVESETDAQVYDRLYQIAKPYLNSERSLTFLSPGARAKQGDTNTGCAQVKRIVNQLKSFGNQSVLGLIDWDGTNNPNERVKVLAHGKRNGIENCVFDPLILACLIARDAKDRRVSIGLTEGGGAYELKQFAPDRLQMVVDSVQTLVLGTDTSASSVAAECSYAGKLKLRIRNDFLTVDDHLLEAKIFDAIPPLREHNRRSGALLKHVVENLLSDFPEFIPTDILDAFSDLLTTEL